MAGVQSNSIRDYDKTINTILCFGKPSLRSIQFLEPYYNIFFFVEFLFNIAYVMKSCIDSGEYSRLPSNIRNIIKGKNNYFLIYRI